MYVCIYCGNIQNTLCINGKTTNMVALQHEIDSALSLLSTEQQR